jgi:topoisomerase IA-like protein
MYNFFLRVKSYLHNVVITFKANDLILPTKSKGKEGRRKERREEAKKEGRKKKKESRKNTLEKERKCSSKCAGFRLRNFDIHFCDSLPYLEINLGQ